MHQKNFVLISQLAGQGRPFVFFADYRAENIWVFEEGEAESQGVQFVVEDHQHTGEGKHMSTSATLQPDNVSFETYRTGFAHIQKHILLGNSYLTNYTLRTPIKTTLEAPEIFALSRAKYRGFFPGRFVFFSPETFVRISADGIISTFPMKGTSDVEHDPDGSRLRNDPKENAEHATIVDLMRNDLAMVASGVQVKRYQYIEPVVAGHGKRLWQMSSEINAQLPTDWKSHLGSILQTLLPAGSISGAPKKKTCEIIAETETSSRGFYTGIAGHFDGKTLDTCVMIRFISLENGQMFYHSGGGITALSDVEKEYHEYRQKIYIPLF